ncbi:flagellar motor protein MotB [Alkalilimnicola ehrlichii MLHE-1]|uniref:OmpA/MotB domain protein n=1 Tax=Alkalilimnicola ehrlichii (strain ATCC BAA-1101 / DSM 17681 / MLHE-1) TaxID=187272 RepID=Q0A8I4_ALKEH|nr:flagellar motor protein MotB [Alkalilimnicola ehrlichii]ABI56853.1 OmpA/MotB domain protein [Alkalilimnicola ehrlichii MLHE-1]
MAGFEDNRTRPIVVKRVKKVVGGHHGGSWKVAFADFMTAMFAMFLVLWIVTAMDDPQRAAVADYFRNPTLVDDSGAESAPSMLDLEGGSPTPLELGETPTPMDQQRDEGAWISEGAMRDLLSELERALEEKEELAEFRDQVLMDMTPDGLRIQLVDAENRPMFDLGSARLRSYAAEILSGLTGVLERVPNALRISGHTDARPFVGRRDYTNWELSTDRANAARRTLTASGIAPYRVAQVVGVAETQPLDPDNPMAPVNRRISIILLTPEADQAMRSPESVAPDAL